MRKMCAALAIVPILLFSVTASAQEWERAVSLFNQKQYRPALREFHAVLRANPEYWQAWYYIGASHFQLQGYEDAIDAFTKYVQAATKDEKAQATGHYYIGLSHFQLQRYDQAIPSLANYIALSEKQKEKVEPTARAALGRAYIFTEKFNEAIPVLTAVAAEMKNNSNNYYYIAYAHQKLGRSQQAITALNQAIAIDPKDADALALLADIQLQQSRQNPAMLKQAIATGEKLQAVRDDQRAWALLGQAYLYDKQYAKAAPLLDKYARANPTVAGAWYNLGLAYSRSSQWKPAAEALEEAAKLAPDNLAILLEMGYVYESDKQPEKALPAYEKAYAASGNRDETARQGIERLKGKQD